jgi:hypothetical protein
MKKLFTLLFLTSLVFISCSKKDDAPAPKTVVTPPPSNEVVNEMCGGGAQLVLSLHLDFMSFFSVQYGTTAQLHY